MSIQIQGNSGTAAEVEATRALRVVQRPIDVVGLSGGSYAAGIQSGTIAAGASADSIVFAARNASSTSLACIKRLRVGVHTLGTGFTAGVALFYVSVVRSYTAADSTGSATVTLTGNNSKLRTSVGTCNLALNIANTGALSGGTGTADSTPIARVSQTFSTAVQTRLMDEVVLEALPGEYPVVLAQNEGIRLYATVPATGTWVLTTQIEWDELPTTAF